ncbi:glutathione S-transferase N-terminal domain-containing protein [Sphingobium sp.]|uniref:glutathione S-transferase family protein n=1 Tax=Sphingobium sp. TaxID=1912891 RepID=UPI0028BD1CF5|nr:glutathione S-transferase N-terminal domain-containing protein [Sphingobium sp.]
MIDIYTDATANGQKVSIALEEMGLDYNVHRIWLGGEQLTSEFTALNPNNKIPVLVDDGLVVTESGAILIYLAEKTGKFLPKDPKGRIRTIEMVFNQMSSLGPMLGQLFVFRGSWENKAPEVSNRYFVEVSRIYAVLNKRLEGQLYMAGDEYTVADMAFLPWIRNGSIVPFTSDLPLRTNPNLAAWLERVLARPAVQKGLTIPAPFPEDKHMEAFFSATVGVGTLHNA